MIIKALCVIGVKAKNGTGPLWPGCTYDVENALAKRLVAQEVAEFVKIPANPVPAASIPGENPPKSVNAPEGATEGEHEIIDLEAMTYTELKAMAQEMGIETGKIKSKAGMIDAITTAMPGIPADDELPELLPQDVVDE